MRSRLRSRLRGMAKRVFDLQDRAPTVSTWSGYTSDALQLADIIDCTLGELEMPQQHPERVNPDPSRQVCNWYVPHFDNPYYGGIMTILRFAARMRGHGVRQRFLICGHAETAKLASSIAEVFPALGDSDVVALDSAAALAAIPPADYSIATLWTTAYVLLKVGNTGLKFYFVQDYEPLFYPAGSTYAQAELTYRFGFIALANTRSIAETYERDYGGRAHTITPCIDPAIFHPPAQPRAEEPRRLFYYARPGIPRNGFELAAAALRRLKRRLGDRVRIECAGAAWSPSDYGLAGVVEPLGLLPFSDTGALYRECHVGLVMMMTRHPSYLPFELMACGALVVSNVNRANTWFLRDGENSLLAPPVATALAQTLERALVHWHDFAPLREQASRDIAKGHADWDAEMDRAFEFVQRQRLSAPTA